MNAQQIRDAINSGHKVELFNGAYEVIKDCLNQYLIHCRVNDNYIGLTHVDNVTLNYSEDSFYIVN